jgi:hypothetical protein
VISVMMDAAARGVMRAGRKGGMMTAITKPPEQVDITLLDRARHRNRLLTITVTALAVALLGLGVWVIYDQATSPETAVTEEIQTLVDDYLAAWNDYDEEALLQLVTADYTLDMVGRADSLTLQAEEASALFSTLEANDWNEVAIGEPIMAGKGPWYVSQVEHFTSPSYGPRGADGVSTFTVVDDGGMLKVARHDYVGNN